MFMSRVIDWLNIVDPYATQRMALYKSLVIAPIMVFAYWFFLPANYTAFVLPTLIVGIYELPVFSSYKEKEKALLFAFFAMLSCGISFYLMFPFRTLFLLYAVIFFSVLYFLGLKVTPSLRFCSILSISSSALLMTIRPQGDRQVAIDIFFSSLLSMTILFVSLRCLRNGYFINWLMAQQQYIKALEEDIDATISGSDVYNFFNEVSHINMVYAYRCLLQKKYLIHVYKMTYNIRNIQFALCNIYYQEKQPMFWQEVQSNLRNLRTCMESRTLCHFSSNNFNPDTLLQQKTLMYLEKATSQWNKLCTIL